MSNETIYRIVEPEGGTIGYVAGDLLTIVDGRAVVYEKDDEGALYINAILAAPLSVVIDSDRSRS